MRPPHSRLLRGARLGVLFGAALAGCLAPAQRLDVTEELARALDRADGLALRTDGLPLDEREDPGETLSLAEALRLALHASPELQAALARVRIAEAEADHARLLPNPVLDVALRFPGGGGGTEVEAGIAESLFGILSRPRRASAAEDRLSAAVAEAVSTALDVVAEVRARHAAAQALDERAALAEERRALLEHLLEVARARLAAGEGARFERTTLEAREIELELELEAQAAERRRERLSLARRIGRPSDDARWSLGERLEPSVPELREEDWVACALEARPELQALRWRLAALGAEAGLAPWQVLEGTELGLSLKQEDVDALGPALVVPLPLFERGGTRRRRAEAALLEARSEWTATRRRIVEEVRRACNDLAAAAQGLSGVRDRLLPLELERQRQVTEAFQHGQVDVTVLLVAEQALQEAQARRIELATEVLQAWARLERAVGGAGPLRSLDGSGAEARAR